MLSNKTGLGKVYSLAKPPHWYADHTAAGRMWECTAALLPFWLVRLVTDLASIRILTLAVLFGFFLHLFVSKLWGRKAAFHDGATFFVCVLFASIAPPQASVFQIFIGIFFAVVLAKECFGGLGQSIFQPALLGSAAAFSIFSKLQPIFVMPTQPALLIQTTAIMIGGIYLAVRRLIAWPASFVFLGVLLIVTLGSPSDEVFLFQPIMMLAAFFLVTDWSSGPVTFAGRNLFAAAGAALVLILARRLTVEEAVMFGILTLNAATPVIDRYFTGRFVRQGRTA